MECRLATEDDLPQIKNMYRAIIDRMEADGIRIWDDVYPCEFFHDDIENARLYVLTEGDVIAAAFALSDSHAGEGSVTWSDDQAKACYLDRLGVSVRFARRGVGSAALREARTLACERGARYLRLFVVDANEPAIGLYRKNGFSRAAGVRVEQIDDALALREFGFELEIPAGIFETCHAVRPLR